MKARFAPSPTGLLHYGNIRTALFNFLLAREQTGEFVLRIEDTDLSRSKDEYIQSLKEDLNWLGINWSDESRQSQRADLYDKYFAVLEEMGLAYPCFCSPEQLAISRKLQLASGKPPRYSGTCRSLSKDEVTKKCDSGLKPTLRFKVENDISIEFEDLIKGPQKFNGNDIGDFIIRRADRSAAFMFCNAIDDADMGISHALRGEDHLTNTPRQVLILRSLNLPDPKYGHFPLIVGDDRSPLSKRNGSETMRSLQEQGYLAEAVLNYLARLGHTSYANKLMDINELAKSFDLNSISSSAAKHDKSHLLHWQKEYILSLEPEALLKELIPYIGDNRDNDMEFTKLVQPNIVLLKDVHPWVDSLYEYKFSLENNEKDMIKEAGEEFFKVAADEYDKEYSDFIKAMQERLGVKGKKLFMPVRLALTGMRHGPQLDDIFRFLGKDEIKRRFSLALDLV